MSISTKKFTKGMAKEIQCKPFRYFRFPFNCVNKMWQIPRLIRHICGERNNWHRCFKRSNFIPIALFTAQKFLVHTRSNLSLLSYRTPLIFHPHSVFLCNPIFLLQGKIKLERIHSDFSIFKFDQI